MGYSFYIGNAVPKFHKDDWPYLSAEWEVEPATHPDAPTFHEDEMTGNGNGRHPSYSVWSEFCRELGIRDLFYTETGHLIHGHPGCQGISKEDLDFVSAAVARHRAKATLPPGFEGWDYKGPDRYDYTLARGIWLEWWMRWALENCETPAIQNT